MSDVDLQRDLEREADDVRRCRECALVPGYTGPIPQPIYLCHRHRIRVEALHASLREASVM